MKTLREALQTVNDRRLHGTLQQLVNDYGPDQTGPYLVTWSQFHGGGVASEHQTAIAAIKAARRLTYDDCCCGCVGIIPADQYANLPYALCR